MASNLAISDSEQQSFQAKEISLATAIEMINLFRDGAILINENQDTLLINQALLSFFPNHAPQDFQLSDLTLISHKSSNTAFDLMEWIKSTSGLEIMNEQMLWLKSDIRYSLIPVEVSVHNIDSDEGNYFLIRVVDLTLQIQADAQKQLMNSTNSGQFITNQHGKITQPNKAFCAFSGLTSTQLSQMTYLDWMQEQVSFSIPLQHVVKALLEKHFWSGEVQVFTDQNNSYEAVLNLSMMLDPKNNIKHFVGVLQDLTDLKKAHAQIEKLAYYDKLTGLANRTLLHDRIEHALLRQKQTLTYDVLFFIDLDGFKIINDTFGHSMGDQLILQIADKLNSITAESDTLARVSGDEFILLHQLETQDHEIAKVEALSVANKIIERIDDRYTIADHSIHSAASVGVCLLPINEQRNQEPNYRTDELTSFADMAMYEAKKKGGNQAYLFEQTLIEKAKQRLELIEALNHSELDEEFQVYFQAQVNKEGDIVSAETLIRWFHPELGFISPGKFIPVAEEGRQIIKIGLWVLHKAFLQAKAWNKVKPIQIAINISPIQFHEQSFVEIIIGLIKFTQVNPKNITLELTEGVLIRNATLARQKIQHLVSLGFQVSIDDFGTGYSSLSYLQKLPIHELKIDQAFIQHVPGHPDDEAIVESIINLAHTKKLMIVAEGVETDQQANYLIQKHPEIILQGFHYSKPIPAQEFEEKFIHSEDKDISQAS